MSQAQAITYDDVNAIAWKRGELTWKLRPEQQRLKAELERPHVQLFVGNISRRWGKSYTLVTYCLEQAYRRTQKIRFGCAFLTDLEEFILPAFELILEDCPEELRPTYIRSRKTWTFPNGSEIKLVGLDKHPNGLRGNAINIIVLDEAGFISSLKRIYTSVIIPATAKQSNIKIIFISTPPESPSHFFVDLIQKAQAQENGYYLCLTIDDISDLDAVERQRLLDEVGGEHSQEAQREFFARILVDPTRAIVPEFTPEVEAHTVTDHARPQYFDHYEAMDVGFTDATAALFGYYDFDNAKLIIEDELLLYHATTDIIASQFLKKEQALYGTKQPYRRVSDNDKRLIADLGSRHNLYFSQTEKHEKEAAINRVRILIKDRKIYINPRCQSLITQLKAGVWNKQRSQFDRDGVNGHFDLIDALIYFCRCVDFNRSPYPTNYGLHSESHHISTATKAPSEDAQAMMRIFKRR